MINNIGNKVRSTEYDAFGNWRKASGQSNIQMLYQGQQQDPESNLYYLRARYYDPATGRFISRDPVKGYLQDPRTQNGYDYALNNPINLSDPSGLEVNGKCISCSVGILGYSYSKTACAVETSSGEKGYTLTNTNSGVLFFKNGIDYSEYNNPTANTLNDLKGESNEFGLSVFGASVDIETEPKTNIIQGTSKSVGWGIDWPVAVYGGGADTKVYTNFEDLTNDLF